MTKYDGENRRETNRRRMPIWPFFILASVGIVAGTSGYAIAPNVPEPEPIVIPNHSEELSLISSQNDSLLAREPEVRTVITERIIRDTIQIPYPVLSDPVIIHDSIPYLVLQIDTVWMPPQIITIPATPRNFWSSETYKPSIGNAIWSIGGFILGNILSSSSSACVVVNGEETCNY